MADFLGQVEGFLLEHPEFLVGFLARYPDVVERLGWSGAQEQGGKVHDLQPHLISNLKGQLDESAVIVHELVETGRENMAVQRQIHRCVESFLKTSSLEELLSLVSTRMPEALDLDCAYVCAEQAEGLPAEVRSVNSVAHWIPPEQPMSLLVGGGQDLQEIFGTSAKAVAEGSGACVRLRKGVGADAMMLVLGSRDAQQFHPGQGHDFVLFLGRCLGLMIGLHQRIHGR